VPWTIVGVAPAGFTGLRLTIEPDITIPLAAAPLLSGRTVESFAARSTQWIWMVGRLKPGVPLSQARAQLEALWPTVRALTGPRAALPSLRDQHAELRLAVTSLARGSEPDLRERFTQPLLLVLGIAVLVLLVACVNLASLSLARAVSRGHEIATRLALGATRWRVCRQFLVEGIVLSTAGGAGGVLVAWWASRTLATVILADLIIPTSFDAAPDPRVVALMLATAIAAGVGFSLAPCWWVIRQRNAASLRVDSRTVHGSGRFGPALVAAQIALAIILVVHAGLLVRTLQQVQSVDSGLNADEAFVAFTSPVVGGYQGVDNNAYYPALIERLQGVPGVESASVSLLKPGGGGGITSSVTPVGSAPGGATREVTRTPVAPAFFRTLGIPLRAGRGASMANARRLASTFASAPSRGGRMSRSSAWPPTAASTIRSTTTSMPCTCPRCRIRMTRATSAW